MKKFKGGLIGCGFFCQHHLAAWRRIPNVEIVAASDLSLETSPGCSWAGLRSAEAMLQGEDLDFVDIVTRSTAHLQLVSMAAEKGLAVICQKPMSPDWETACRMVEISERPSGAGHDPRQLAVAVLVSRRGRDDRPGRHWNAAGLRVPLPGQRWYGRGALPRQAYFRQLQRFMIDEALVHHIDTARFLFGDIASVYAEGARRNPRIVGEDHVILTLRHVNSTMGWIDGNSFCNSRKSGPTLDEATFEGDTGSIRINSVGEIWSGDERIWRDPGYGYRGDSVYATQAHFIECLETGRPFETGARDYLEKTFAVVEAAYSSMASHRAVEIARA